MVYWPRLSELRNAVYPGSAWFTKIAYTEILSNQPLNTISLHNLAEIYIIYTPPILN